MNPHILDGIPRHVIASHVNKALDDIDKHNSGQKVKITAIMHLIREYKISQLNKIHPANICNQEPVRPADVDPVSIHPASIQNMAMNGERFDHVFIKGIEDMIRYKNHKHAYLQLKQL